MFGGKLLVKTRKTVPGTYRQEAWSDTWHDSIDIEYDGDLEVPEVQAAIRQAFYNSKERTQAGSLWGNLRAPGADSVLRIDSVKRQLIISCSCRLCD